MNNSVSVPKDGRLANTNSNQNFPTWSNLLEDFFNRDLPSVFSSNYNTGYSLPKVNIRETADNYQLEMAAPGLKKSDFNLEIDNQVLTISTETKEEQEHKEENYTRREFGYSSFKRTFNLPESVDDGQINASYNEGILRILLPKKEEAKQKPARNIEIS